MSLLDTDSLLREICKFFVEEWPHVPANEVSVKQLADGYNSNILLIERNATGCMREPQKLVVRMPIQRESTAESSKDPLHMSPLEQALTCCEFARIGGGVRLYGIFPTGRLEEFVYGHCLTQFESEDPVIRSQVARSYARFHSMSLPCDKSRMSFLNETMARLFEEERGSDKMLMMTKDTKFAMSEHFDLAIILQTALKRLHDMNGKKCWCVIDPQFGNVMVRDEPLPNEEKVVLIDFEYTTYHYRAFDIGGHFLEKMLDWNGVGDRRSGGRSYTEEEKRHFCSEYLEECASILPESVDAVVDSLDHLMAEAKQGMQSRILFILFCILRHFARLGTDDPHLVNISNWLIDLGAEIHEIKDVLETGDYK